MANLDHIQQLLNASEDYQQRFLEDPVAALAQEGLLLSFEMQRDIRRQVKDMQVLGAAASGAVGPGSPSQFTSPSSKKAPGKGDPKKEFLMFKLAVVFVSSY